MLALFNLMFSFFLLLLSIRKAPLGQYSIELNPEEAKDPNKDPGFLLLIPVLIFTYFIYFAITKIREASYSGDEGDESSLGQPEALEIKNDS